MKEKGSQPLSGLYFTPEQQIRQHYSWFPEAKRLGLGNTKLAGRRLGISRKTFYKWEKRFAQAHGERSALR